MSDPSLILPLLLSLFLASLWLTSRVRQYALRHGMLDQPNERSSHSTPTPRGGGLGFSLLILVSLGLLMVCYPESRHVWIGVLGGGTLVAGVGWLDDRVSLPAKHRIVVHLTAAAWAVYWIGGLPRLELGFGTLQLGVMGGLLAVIAVVWSTNLFNFMDGIDGIAGSQAVYVGTVTAVIAATLGHTDLSLASGAIAASVGGFLIWNWPPAKIFMGDCGSGLLGFLIAVLAIASETRGATPLLVWVMLMSVFWIDATATLLRRILAGESWYEAHCSHAYQRAAIAGFSHRSVTGSVILINLVLICLATACVIRPNLMAPILAVSSGAILLLWFKFARLAPTTDIASDESPTESVAGERTAA